jgi:hypothetical protein
MDNLPAHRPTSVRRATEAVGARLTGLPPFWLDLLPTEPCRSKVKSILCSPAARAVDALGRTITAAFNAVTNTDLRCCFRPCGYLL